MRLLLDTHVALWELADDPSLKATARDLIRSPDNTIFVSVVTLWEIAIKYACRRGRSDDMPLSASEAFGYFRDARYEILDVTSAHVLALAELSPIHADPFDRMLVAQARSEPARLLTSDRLVAAYGEGVTLI